jgi:putative serine protease PepD
VPAVAAVLALVVATVAVMMALGQRGAVDDLETQVAAQRHSIDGLTDAVAQANKDLKTLQTQLGQAKAGSIDTRAVAPKVLKSVFTIETPSELGTAFAVRRSDTGGTILITNYHVVRDQWVSGARSVSLRQGSRTITGKIDTVRPNDDLASVEVIPALPLLPMTTKLPAVGTPVLVVGSPLGLGGTVTTGVISALRKDLLQISAPISPGNSGGPVVDAAGRAVGIASSKIVSNNAEGLGFAIPVSKVCSSLLHC